MESFALRQSLYNVVKLPAPQVLQTATPVSSMSSGPVLEPQSIQRPRSRPQCQLEAPQSSRILELKSLQHSYSQPQRRLHTPQSSRRVSQKDEPLSMSALEPQPPQALQRCNTIDVDTTTDCVDLTSSQDALTYAAPPAIRRSTRLTSGIPAIKPVDTAVFHDSDEDDGDAFEDEMTRIAEVDDAGDFDDVDYETSQPEKDSTWVAKPKQSNNIKLYVPSISKQRKLGVEDPSDDDENASDDDTEGSSMSADDICRTLGYEASRKGSWSPNDFRFARELMRSGNIRSGLFSTYERSKAKAGRSVEEWLYKDFLRYDQGSSQIDQRSCFSVVFMVIWRV